MSADNYIGVLQNKVYDSWTIVDGCMSVEMEDCQYIGRVLENHSTRETAIVRAHDIMKDMSIVEYGVIELDAYPRILCGKCYVCVHDRLTVAIASTVPNCYKCGEPISSSEWVCLTQGHTYHSRCEPNKQ